VVNTKIIASIVVVLIVIGAIGAYYYVGTSGSGATSQGESAAQSTQSTESTTGGVIAPVLTQTLFTSSTQSTSPLQGSIAVSGAFAIYPLMVTWGEQFQSLNPSVQVQVSAGGAGKGMSDVLGGLVDIGMVSRNITQVELQRGAYPVEVAKGGVVAVVNPSNPVLAQILSRGLSKPTLAGIFIDGNVTTWGQAIGESSASNAPAQFSDKIDAYTRSDSAGAATSWAAYFGKTQQDLVGVGVFGDTGMLQAVETDPLGIGFVNLPYAYDNSTGSQVKGIVVVPLDLKNNGVLDTSENFYATLRGVSSAVATGAYPIRTDLYLVTKGKPTGTVKVFILWILTVGQKDVVPEGFVQLPSSVIAQEVAQLQS